MQTKSPSDWEFGSHPNNLRCDEFLADVLSAELKPAPKLPDYFIACKNESRLSFVQAVRLHGVHQFLGRSG